MLGKPGSKLEFARRSRNEYKEGYKTKNPSPNDNQDEATPSNYCEVSTA